MKKLAASLIVATAAVIALPAHAAPDDATKDVFRKLIQATVMNDYDAFVEPADATLKAAITKQMLEGVSQQMAPRMKPGFDSYYMGELNQQGCKVHLWRLQFKDGGDDVLATLSIKDGKAAGFFLK